jgi:Ca2+-binding RTX toxin-like protein
MLILYRKSIVAGTLITTLLACSIWFPLTVNAVPKITRDPYGLHTTTPELNSPQSKSTSGSDIATMSTSISSLYNFSNVQKKSNVPIKSDLNIPKNLIVPKACTQNCTIVGTQKDDIIIATAVTNAVIYGLGGNDVIQCGSGICKIYGGPGNNVMISGSSSTAQLYGGSGNNIFIGSTGDTLMVGGKGNDQFYAGFSHDVMIGGGGANYFDCGPNGNGVVLDFNAKNGDTKASNCKFVITTPSGAVKPPIS